MSSLQNLLDYDVFCLRKRLIFTEYLPYLRQMLLHSQNNSQARGRKRSRLIHHNVAHENRRGGLSLYESELDTEQRENLLKDMLSA